MANALDSAKPLILLRQMAHQLELRLFGFGKRSCGLGVPQLIYSSFGFEEEVRLRRFVSRIVTVGRSF